MIGLFCLFNEEIFLEVRVLITLIFLDLRLVMNNWQKIEYLNLFNGSFGYLMCSGRRFGQRDSFDCVNAIWLKLFRPNKYWRIIYLILHKDKESLHERSRRFGNEPRTDGCGTN